MVDQSELIRQAIARQQPNDTSQQMMQQYGQMYKVNPSFTPKVGGVQTQPPQNEPQGRGIIRHVVETAGGIFRPFIPGSPTIIQSSVLEHQCIFTTPKKKTKKKIKRKK
jgi:hypothetical protein